LLPRKDLIPHYRIKGPVCFPVGKPGNVFRTLSKALNPALPVAARNVFKRRERSYTNSARKESESNTIRFPELTCFQHGPFTIRVHLPGDTI
jgi:hypothetical protein